MAKVKAGEGSCPVCSNRVVWRLSDSGALSCFCQDCDVQLYAKDGTEAKRVILAKIGAAPAPKAPAPDKKPAPTPEKPPKAGIFGGLGL